MRGTTAAVIPLRGMARGWDREGDRCGGTSVVRPPAHALRSSNVRRKTRAPSLLRGTRSMRRHTPLYCSFSIYLIDWSAQERRTTKRKQLICAFAGPALRTHQSYCRRLGFCLAPFSPSLRLREWSSKLPTRPLVLQRHSCRPTTARRYSRTSSRTRTSSTAPGLHCLAPRRSDPQR